MVVLGIHSVILIPASPSGTASMVEICVGNNCAISRILWSLAKVNPVMKTYDLQQQGDDGNVERNRNDHGNYKAILIRWFRVPLRELFSWVPILYL